jgi:hypothetical protein
MSISDNSNWNEVRQSIVNDISEIKDYVIISAKNNITKSLIDKGVDKSKIKILSNGIKIFFDSSEDDAFELGKIYFNEILSEINQPNWLDTII